MTSFQWKKNVKKVVLNQMKDDGGSSKSQAGDDYKIQRLRPRRRKKRHAGFTIIPGHRLWIFEK